MARLSIVGPDQGEVIELGGSRLRVLEDGSTTDHRLGVIELTLAPHSEGPPQHRHSQHDEGFYVISGTVRFTVGDEVHDATAGAMAMVPPGVPHTFGNPGDEPAVMVSTVTPDFYIRYFEEIRDWIASGRPMTHEAQIGMMAGYATVPSTEHGPEAG
ncbi:cupin domain-containing protein [Umezawaea tangerina]|uniref:Quercetin dioxygenase-like cupin family protein n=1 Tax=Umezawaea tangerina TaxID=84725 RepID=A0A2T0TGH1_9PSEU|nr:cupin domain-containing protein [Umezawaea tangerina]PRY44770.1 quercetin dioxygenase-like cupin family protein [Umezawaea tangerina]